jgi:SAM-dependent methyltransferase
VTERDVATWDAAAATFDLAADHGLRSAAVRWAWADLLTRLLPPSPARVADLGCGTGTLSLLAAELGHVVDGVDFSERMLAVARGKAAGRRQVTFTLGDAAAPPLRRRHYDVVLCRHLLWALPDPVAALTGWTELLLPDGVLVLVEGRWSTGAGFTAEETVGLLRRASLHPVVEPLKDPRYWGGGISDERYVATARRPRLSRSGPDRCTGMSR